MGRRHLGFLLAAVAGIGLMLGCPNPIVGNQGGNLIISFNDAVSRTLVPAIDMNPASYDASGSGPDGASFTQSTSGNSLTVPHLAFGDWTVTATAKNAAGAPIGVGSGTTRVITNSTVSISITVRPYDGFGTLKLGLNWTAAQVQTAQVQSSLLPSSGGARLLTFAVDTAAGTAGFSANDIPTGYHTLTLKLLDNGSLCMGAVEVVRIVKDQTTSGSYTFANINQGTGSLQVNVTPEMADPLDVAVSGTASSKPANQALALTAAVSNYSGNVTYAWYVNGDAKATGTSFDFDTSYAQGYYRIDVTAFSADGSRAGSDSTSVRVVPPTGPGTLSIIAGGGQAGAEVVGPATSAYLSSPMGIAFDPEGNLYIVDCSQSRIRKVSSNGTISVFAGNGSTGFSGDGGFAIDAAFGGNPHGIAVDSHGNVFVNDSNNYRIRRIDASSEIITTFAGGGSSNADNIPATSALIGSFYGDMCFDAQDNLYFPDGGKIRKIDTSGIVTTAAGGGLAVGDGGPATQALLNGPTSVAVAPNGDIYFTEMYGNQVRKVIASTGIIHTIGGNGTRDMSPDGSIAANSPLGGPTSLALGPTGQVYFAEYYNNRVRKIDASGVLGTVAGGGTMTGNNIPATSALLSNLYLGMCTDPAGSLYFSEWMTGLVRKVTF